MADQTGAVDLARRLEVLAEHLRRIGEVHDAALIREGVRALERIPKLEEVLSQKQAALEASIAERQRQEGEGDAMRRRAEAAESDWQAAEKRAERVEAALAIIGRWFRFSESGRAYYLNSPLLNAEDAEVLRAALAPTPEDSERFPEIVGDWNSAEDATYDGLAPAPGEEGK